MDFQSIVVYFGFCTPMLYVIQKGYMGVKKVNPIDIVYCVTSIQKILDCQKAFLFTDGQANSALTSYYENDRIGEVNELVDFNAVASKYWFDEEDVDKKRRKEAELLLDGDLTKEFIIGYVCYNEEARTKLINSGVEESKIVIKRGYYF